MARQDIMLDTANDLIIKDGDFLVDLSDNQHQKIIIEVAKGEFLEHPLIGVGIRKEINGTASLDKVKADIQLNLEADDYTVQKIKIENGVIDVNAIEKTNG